MATLSTLTDIELLVLLGEDNTAALTEIYNRYWETLYAIAIRKLDNEHDAQEVVQNIFISIWNRRATLTLTHTLATYLSVSVKYQIFTRLALIRKHKAKYAPLTFQTEQGAETTTDWLSERELRLQIEQHINELPKKCRIVFKLSREKHLTNAQIAEELNISEKTVEGHITNALHSLRGSLHISLPLLLALLKK